MKNCRAKEGTEKRKGSESENFAVNHRYYDALKTIAILRAIDSKTLNLLFVSIRVRSAFLKKALQQNHLKETQIREWSASESYRKRTTTYYIITRTGLNYLAGKQGDIFSRFIDIDGSVPVFDSNEYGQDKRKRLLSFRTAAVLAKAAGANINLSAFSYLSGTGRKPEDDSGHEPAGNPSLPMYYERYLTPEFIDQCGLLKNLYSEEDDQFMTFHSGQEVKRIVTTASVQGTSRDFSSGKYAGVIDSHFKSMMIFVAPSFTMSWSDWNMRDELTAYGLWARRNRIPDQYQRDRNGTTAALIVDNAREFAYHFLGCQKKGAGESFGGKFSHMYIVPNDVVGAAFLRWIMLMDEKSMAEQLNNDAVSFLGYEQNRDQFSREVFPLRSEAGAWSAAGFILDGKKIQVWYNAATRNPTEKLEIICWEWQKDFYKRVLPENVSYSVVEGTGEYPLIAG